MGIPDENICVKTSSGKCYNINLNEHCIFCLRRATLTTKPGRYSADTTDCIEQLEEVLCSRKTDPDLTSKLLSSLNKVWRYLQKRGNWDGVLDLEREANNPTVEFSRLPTICYFCVAHFEAIYQLIGNLMTEINKLGNVIRNSRSGGNFSWRKDNFEKSLHSSELNTAHKLETLQFLGFSTMGKVFPAVVNKDNVKRRKLENTNDERMDRDCNGDVTGDDTVELKSEISSSSDESDDENSNSIVKYTVIISNSQEGSLETSNREEIQLDGMEDDIDSDIGSDNMDRNDPDYSLQEEEITLSSEDNQESMMESDDNTSRPPIQSFRRKVWKCDLCGVDVPPEEREEHVRCHVGDEYMIKCPNPDPKKCSKSFCTIQGLARHLNSCKPCAADVPDYKTKYINQKFVCETCGQRFPTRELCKHLRRHHENSLGNLTCPIDGCRQRFSLRQAVLLHISSHIESLTTTNAEPLNHLKCDACKLEVPVGEMESHLKETHGIQDIIRCNQCPLLFASRESLIEHVYIHGKSGKLFCDICEEGNKTVFERHHELREHYYEKHQIGKKASCEQCEKEYFSVKMLKWHMKTTHQNTVTSKKCPENRFPCTQCSTSFQTKSNLKDHEIKKHGAELLWCSVCNQKFPTCDARMKHEEREHGGTGNKFVCSERGCGKSFKLNTLLNEHRSKEHKDVSVCELCGKTFSHHTNLLEHKKSVHLAVKRHMCETCKKSFWTSTACKRHKLIHSREGPFICSEPGCMRSFKMNKYLEEHITKEHSHPHLKPHVCELCGKSYSHQGSLYLHRKTIHLGLRTHVCDICGKGFAASNTLKRHKQTHSSERPFVCDVCGQPFRQKDKMKRHKEGHVKKGSAFKPIGPVTRKQTVFRKK